MQTTKKVTFLQDYQKKQTFYFANSKKDLTFASELKEWGISSLG